MLTTRRTGKTENSTTNLNEAMRLATMHGHDKVMHFLLQTGGDINYEDSSGSTMLFTVVDKNFPDCVEVLLHHGIDVNARNHYGDTALHVACEKCSIDCLQILLSHDGINANIQNKIGCSPLMVAAKAGFEFGVESLIHAGCDVNKMSDSHKSALHYCLGKGVPLQHDQDRLKNPEVKQSCLKHLLLAGADINCSDSEGFAPLHYAVKTDSLAIVRLLVEKNCYLNEHGFFGQISPEKLNTLLCRGDMNTRATPISAFLLAVYYRNVNIARFLVESGCQYYRCQFVLAYLKPNDDIYEYLNDVFQKVGSLQQLCIMGIRESLGVDMENKVSSLPIPNKLKRDICDL